MQRKSHVLRYLSTALTATAIASIGALAIRPNKKYVGSEEDGGRLLEREQKRTRGREETTLIQIFTLKKNKGNFLPIMKSLTETQKSCASDHVSVRRIIITESFELQLNFLISLLMSSLYTLRFILQIRNLEYYSYQNLRKI